MKTIQKFLGNTENVETATDTSVPRTADEIIAAVKSVPVFIQKLIERSSSSVGRRIVNYVTTRVLSHNPEKMNGLIEDLRLLGMCRAKKSVSEGDIGRGDRKELKVILSKFALQSVTILAAKT